MPTTMTDPLAPGHALCVPDLAPVPYAPWFYWDNGTRCTAESPLHR